MRFFKSQLKNGVTLITIPMVSTETVTTLAMFGSGSRSEVQTEKGLAHFTEHMFFKGTKRRPSSLEVAMTIENIGGEFNAFTDKEHTAYYTKLPAQHAEVGFDFLSDLILEPLVPEEEVVRERGVVIEEINMYEDMPIRDVSEVIDQAVYGDSPMGWSIAGTKASVGSFMAADVRRFIGRHYVADNLVLAVAGKITPEAAERLAERYFLAIPSGERQKPEPVAASLPLFAQRVKKKKTEQAHFVLAFPTVPATDPERFVARAAATLMGGGMSSRLFISIRERQGLCYYIQAGAHHFSDSGIWQVQAGVDTSRFGQAIHSTLDELDKLSDKEVEEAELARSKELMKGRMLIRLEDSEEVANFFAKQHTLGQPLETPGQTVQHIDAVTTSQVRQFARERLQRRQMAMAAIGPVTEQDIGQTVKQ